MTSSLTDEARIRIFRPQCLSPTDDVYPGFARPRHAAARMNDPIPPKPFRMAVKAVILDEQQRCLLIRRSAHNHNFVGCWEWPGGKVDAGEDFATAVLRETREETGLTVEITGLAGTMTFEMPAAHVVLLCMEASRIAGEPRLSEEHDDLAWVPLGKLADYPATPGIAEFMLDYAQKKGKQS